MKKFSIRTAAVVGVAMVLARHPTWGVTTPYLDEPVAVDEQSDVLDARLFDDFDDLLDDHDGDPPLEGASQALLTGTYRAAAEKADAILAKDPDSVLAHEIKAAALVRSGEIEEGMEILEHALRFAPEPAVLVRRMGDTCLTLGELEMAEAQFKRALALDPNDRRPHQRLGYIYDRTGRTDEAVVAYKIGRGRGPAGRLGVNVLLGDLYNRWGRFAETIDLLEEPVVSDTRTPIAHTVLGSAYLGTAKFPEAVRELEIARELDPGSVRNLLALAVAYQGTEQSGESREALEEVIKRKPDWAGGHQYLGDLEVLEGNLDAAIECYQRAADRSEDTSRMRDRIAAIHLSLKRYDEAIPILEEMLESWESTFAVYDALSRAYAGSDAPDAAEALLVRAREVFPGDPLPFYKLGDLNAQRGRYEDAIEQYGKAMAMAPDDDRWLRGLAYAHNNLEELPVAIEYAERAVAARPENPDNRLILASLHEKAGRIETAIGLYKEVLRNYPWHVTAQHNLAMIDLASGDRRAALFRVRQIRQNNPDLDPGLAVSLARICHDAGAADKAIELYEEALAKDPENIVALNNLALLRADARYYDRALELAEEAYALAPEAGHILDTLGWVHYRAGAIDQAVSHLERAMELEPQNPGMRYHLAVVYRATGRTKEAGEQIAAALELSSDFSEYEDAVQLKEELGL